MDALNTLHRHGLKAAAKDGNLLVSPADRIIPEIHLFIRQHKAAILAELTRDPIAEAARHHGIDAERLRKELTTDDIDAITQDLPGERAAPWVFASIIAKQICMEREEAFAERAAIREYDGGQSREQAEEAASQEVYCRDCAHWAPDSLNPDMGLGACSVRRAGSLPLPWPGATCRKAKPREVSP